MSSIMQVTSEKRRAWHLVENGEIGLAACGVTCDRDTRREDGEGGKVLNCRRCLRALCGGDLSLIRLPYEPLARFVVDRFGSRAEALATMRHRFGESAASSMERRLARGVENGYVSVAVADDLSVRMFGVHPVEIWPEWFNAELGVAA